jgi:phenylacetate-CoA ligase
MQRMREIIHSVFRKKEMQSLIQTRKRSRISSIKLHDDIEKNFLILCNQAANKSPYYKSVFNNIEINSIIDLKKIPLLTKEILKKQYSNIICEPDKAFFVLNSTSGSTGAATKFGSDARFIIHRDVDLIRGNEMNKEYKYLDKMVTFWGAERDIINEKNVRNYYNFFVKQQKLISTYHMTQDDIADNIQLLNKFKPKLVVGYPSALNFMANYIAKDPKVLAYKPRAIISAGEMLYDEQRENIEKYFGSSVFNRYGCREVGHIASECSSHDGMHYDADRLIVEIIDDNGNPCPPNTVGNIVVTDLFNHVFPLIRYKIGDLGSISDNIICDCGCTLPKISKIEGRAFDVIQGVNGNSVSGSFWTLAFRFKVKGVDSFQVRQKVLDEIKLHLKVNESYNDNQKTKIIDIIKTKLGNQTKVEIELVKDFEYSPTGKFKWVVSELKQNK